MDIYLNFSNSTEAFTQRLQTFVDHILAQGLTENKPPSITFAGSNRGVAEGIVELRRAFDKNENSML